MEFINFLYDLIRIDIFIAFGYYSVLYFILHRFVQGKKALEEIDNTATQVIIFAGILFFLLWGFSNLLYYFQIENEVQRTAFKARITGKYWFGFWLQPIFWMLLTQLFWIKKLRKLLAYRIIFSAFFIFTFERLVILLTSFQKDYLPSSWSMNLSATEIMFGAISKVLVFTILICVVQVCKFGWKSIRHV